MALHQEAEGRRFLTFAEGKLREKVADGDTPESEVKSKYPEATFRSGETPNKEPFAKWELTYPGITAFITGIELQKGNFGKQVLIHLKDENEEEFVLALGAKTIAGANFMQMIPNVDYSKELTVKAYKTFKTNDGKEIPGGVSFQQDGEKLRSAFYDPEKKEQLLGMPAPEVDKRTKEVDWDTYWPIRDKWLQEYLLDNGLMKYVDAVEQTENKDDDNF